MNSRLAVLTVLFFIALVFIVQPFLARPSGDARAQEYRESTLGKPYIILKNGLMIAPRRSVFTNSEVKSNPSTALGTSRMRILVTAYSSSPDETDDNPFITASGTYTSYGVLAANFLPIGTRVRFPKLFGSQVFVVEDRMNARYNNRLDIWMPTKAEAIKFGEKITEAEIL